MNVLTRKNGIWLCVIGLLMQVLNILTLTLWEIDIDIFGAMIFVLGLVIAITCGKTMKHSSGWLTRRNGVWLCVIAMLIVLITALVPFINGDFGGIFGLGVFLLGVILIAVRWKY